MSKTPSRKSSLGKQIADTCKTMPGVKKVKGNWLGPWGEALRTAATVTVSTDGVDRFCEEAEKAGLKIVLDEFPQPYAMTQTYCVMRERGV
jgi:hypothetical protein